jgi:S-adenosylmethionine/arginine decarboxylase-like enzyme
MPRSGTPPGPMPGRCEVLATPEGCADAEEIVAAVEGAARGRAFVRLALHRWSPRGVSGLWIVEGGRVVVHTWPERGVATIDAWAPEGAWAAVDAVAKEAAARLRWRGRPEPSGGPSLAPGRA